jgi:hypothetical protein
MFLLYDVVISWGWEELYVVKGGSTLSLRNVGSFTEYMKPMFPSWDTLFVTRKELRKSDGWHQWRSLGTTVSEVGLPIRSPITCRIVWQKTRWIMGDSSSSSNLCVDTKAEYVQKAQPTVRRLSARLWIQQRISGFNDTRPTDKNTN